MRFIGNLGSDGNGLMETPANYIFQAAFNVAKHILYLEENEGKKSKSKIILLVCSNDLPLVMNEINKEKMFGKSLEKMNAKSLEKVVGKYFEKMGVTSFEKEGLSRLIPTFIDRIVIEYAHPITTQEATMCLLSMCPHSVLTGDLTGWWGALLSEGHPNRESGQSHEESGHPHVETGSSASGHEHHFVTYYNGKRRNADMPVDFYANDWVPVGA